MIVLFIECSYNYMRKSIMIVRICGYEAQNRNWQNIFCGLVERISLPSA